MNACSIYDLLRDIKDPEFPNTLEDLGIISEEKITVSDDVVTVYFKPTITHCSLATMIGLCLQTKLHRELGQEYKIDVLVEPGFHEKEHSVNKQINDKERRAAALEDSALLAMVEECLAAPDY
ncbi:hypothetical protein ACHWQZ_G002882 [Mnemiopsis leidyi]